MNDGSLAEVFEELKELRRKAKDQRAQVLSKIADDLDEIYNHLFEIGFHAGAQLVRKIIEDLPHLERSGRLIRTLEIKTLADRVFGDQEKSEVWLQRSNPSLSGQTPADLLEDELGAAIVRETLERIDHGIFA